MIKRLIAIAVTFLLLATTHHVAERSGYRKGVIRGCFYTYKEWFPYLYDTGEADMSIIEHCKERYE